MAPGGRELATTQPLAEEYVMDAYHRAIHGAERIIDELGTEDAKRSQKNRRKSGSTTSRT